MPQKATVPNSKPPHVRFHTLEKSAGSTQATPFFATLEAQRNQVYGKDMVIWLQSGGRRALYWVYIEMSHHPSLEIDRNISEIFWKMLHQSLLKHSGVELVAGRRLAARMTQISLAESSNTQLNESRWPVWLRPFALNDEGVNMSTWLARAVSGYAQISALHRSTQDFGLSLPCLEPCDKMWQGHGSPTDGSHQSRHKWCRVGTNIQKQHRSASISIDVETQ